MNGILGPVHADNPYEALDNTYGAPGLSGGYDAPAANYNAPQTSYNSPQQTSYNAPQQTSYNAPQTNYNAPQTSYNSPQSYNAPAGGAPPRFDTNQIEVTLVQQTRLRIRATQTKAFSRSASKLCSRY